MFVNLKRKIKKIIEISRKENWDNYKENKAEINEIKKQLNKLLSEKSSSSVASLKERIRSVENKNLSLESKIKSFEMQFEDLYIKRVNEELLETKAETLILTTYPETTTKNVGDAMITEAFLKLLCENKDIDNYVTVFRGTALDRLELNYVKNILAPGFSIVNDTYPKNYKLFKDINELRKFNFVPFGCSYQHYLPEHGSFGSHFYDSEGISFLNKIVEFSGPLPVRDEKINGMMKELGVDSYYSGDLVLFDPDQIGMEPTLLKDTPKRIAFSVQHKAKYINQSLKVIEAVKNKYPNAEVYVTCHGEENKVTEALKAYANENEIGFITLSGEAKNLDFYDTVDLHVGYRLHGHISFLRRRKPSILILEDARSFGFANTPGTAMGCFNALDEKREIKKNIEEEVLRFIEEQESRNFEGYRDVFNFIDNQYENVLKEKLSMISRKLNA